MSWHIEQKKDADNGETLGESYTGNDPGVSEWGNPIKLKSFIILKPIHNLREGNPGN